MPSGLSAGFMLDRQWHWLRGEMEPTKKPALLALGRLLEESGVPYAIIGAVAAQIHLPEPRTTLDVEVAVMSRSAIPRDALPAAGFRHSRNWESHDGTPLQFTDDAAVQSAISSAEEIALEDVRLRVIGAVDLLHEKTTPAARCTSVALQMFDRRPPAP